MCIRDRLTGADWERVCGLGGGALEVAMPGAALVLGRRVQVYERIHGLHNDPQLLPPRERLRRGREARRPAAWPRVVGSDGGGVFMKVSFNRLDSSEISTFARVVK